LSPETVGYDRRVLRPGKRARLFLVRHGQSAGNIAADVAQRAAATRLTLETRDMDVDLSPLGEEQSRATAIWAQKARLRHPRVFTSPYRRADRTAELALEGVDRRRDERLREREFGALDRLTTRGVELQYPEQAAARAFLGKFYHRPPGGESWVDVGLRIRSFFGDVERVAGSDEDIVVVTHRAVILMMRYVLEELDEATVLAIDRDFEVANCSVTTYRRTDAGWTLAEFASVSHLQPHEVTRAGDYTGAPR
jgi:2,3-bisphosphoglycerate-dependent phosphoglycerate mutase